MKTWQKVAAWSVIALALVVARCGGDDDKADETAATPTEVAVDASTEAPPTTAPTEAAADPAAEYGQWVRARLTDIASPLGTLQGLMTDMSESPALLLDSEWKTKMGLNLGLVQLGSKILQEREAPAGAEDAKAAVDAATGSLIDASTLIASSIDNMEPETLKIGLAKIGEAGGQMTALAGELDKIDPQ